MVKVVCNKAILKFIRTNRDRLKITGAQVSEKIHQRDSYMSAVENGRIQSISYDNLKIIVKYLLKCDDEKAESVIERLIHIEDTTVKDIDLYNVNGYKVPFYGTDDEINEFTEMINKSLKSIYSQYPDLVDKFVRTFNLNLMTDKLFFISVFSLPFYKLKDVDQSEKQKIIDDISQIINKFSI